MADAPEFDLSGDLSAMLDRQGAAYTAKLRQRKPREPKAAKPAHALERDHRKDMVKFLRQQGCIVSSNINEMRADSKDRHERARFWAAMVSTGSTAGFPDLTVIARGGRVFFIEVKRPKTGRVSVNQDKIHAEMRQRGLIVLVAHDLWSLQAELEQAGIVLSWKTARAEALR